MAGVGWLVGLSLFSLLSRDIVCTGEQDSTQGSGKEMRSRREALIECVLACCGISVSFVSNNIETFFIALS